MKPNPTINGIIATVNDTNKHLGPILSVIICKTALSRKKFHLESHWILYYILPSMLGNWSSVFVLDFIDSSCRFT